MADAPATLTARAGDGSFTGRVAVVTGGARGIGAAIAARLAADGAAVAVLDIAAGDDEVDGMATLRCDVTDEDGVLASLAKVAERSGPIDVLVNNAGVNAYFDPVAMTTRDWDAFFAVDLKAAWLCAREVLPSMVERGSGAIVNVSSIHARLTTQGMFPYSAAKAGLIGLTRSLALEVGPDGVRVNAVAPGWVRTPLVEEHIARQPDPDVYERRVIADLPLRRMATPADVADVVAFLAGDRAAYITGAVVPVDGGLGVKVSLPGSAEGEGA